MDESTLYTMVTNLQPQTVITVAISLGAVILFVLWKFVKGSKL